jgi:hypothetical protein
VEVRAAGKVRGEVVVRLPEEVPVGVVEKSTLRVPDESEATHHAGEQDEDEARGHHDDDRSRQEPPHSPGVKPAQPKRPGLVDLTEKDAGDQEARQDEEEVDPDEATSEARHPRVEEEDDVDRQRTNAVQSGPVGPFHMTEGYAKVHFLSASARAVGRTGARSAQSGDILPVARAAGTEMLLASQENPLSPEVRCWSRDPR